MVEDAACSSGQAVLFPHKAWRLSLLLRSSLAWQIMHKVLTPISGLADVTKIIASGNYSAAIDYQSQG